MAVFDDTGYAVATTLMLFAIAIALPDVVINWPFDLNIGQDFSTLAISLMRLGLIALAVNIGLKPLSDNDSEVF